MGVTPWKFESSRPHQSDSGRPDSPGLISRAAAFNNNAHRNDWAATAVALRMDTPRGVVLMDAMAGGAAAASGLLPGDVILAFNNVPVEGGNDLSRDLDIMSAGGSPQLTI